jgi:quercetin dioxygenase-like cupin family protein
VLAGHGDLTLDDSTRRVEAGAVALAPAGVVHALHNPGPGRLIVLIAMAPPPGS